MAREKISVFSVDPQVISVGSRENFRFFSWTKVILVGPRENFRFFSWTQFISVGFQDEFFDYFSTWVSEHSQKYHIFCEVFSFCWSVFLWLKVDFPYECRKTVFFTQKLHIFRQKMFACGAEYFKNIENLLSGEISLAFHSINQNWCSMLTDEAIFTCRRPSAISLTSGSWNRNSGNLLTVKKKFAWLADTLTQAILSCESQNDQRGAYLGPIIRKCGSTGKPEYTKANWKTWNFHAGQLQWPAVRLKTWKFWKANS